MSAFLPPLAAAQLEDASPRFFVRAGVLINGSGAEPRRDTLIEVRDGRIAAVGSAAEFGSALEDAPARDFGAQVVMPGLIDAHAHPTIYPDRRPYEEQLRQPDEMLSLVALHQLALHLRSGVITVRDCGARGRIMFWVREAVRRGPFVGPRLQLAGRAITHSAGHL